MKSGDAVQYVDAHGTNHRALVFEEHDVVSEHGQPPLSLVVVLDGKVVKKRAVVHREERITVQPPRTVFAKKPNPDGTPRVIAIVRDERRRHPGDFWVE